MTSLTVNDLKHMTKARYPNAQRFFLDGHVETWDKDRLQKVYGQFVWQMKLIGLGSWLKDKLDCEDWALLFRAYVTVRKALSTGEYAKAVGLLCYLIDGDVSRPHAINVVAVRNGAGAQVQELEPQPNGGLINLTKEERDSAWLVLL